MSSHVYGAFVLACIVLSITPGPNMSLFIANGAAHGVTAALSTVAGTASGNLLLVVIAMAGMSAAIAIMAGWFEAVRWAGAIYLIWLGLRQLRLCLWPDPAAPSNAPRRSRWYWQGLAVSLSNPKVVLFLGAFVPQFLDNSADFPPGLQLAVLGATFIAVTTLIDGVLAFAAGSAQSWFNDERRRAANGLSGLLLICGGLWLSTARRA
jgi:threonine/homoserine/homoserine lactone efflux protein